MDGNADAARSPDLLLDAGELDTQYHTARERVLEAFELQYLSNLLHRTGVNMSQAAKIAGVDRTTLYRLMDKYHLQRDSVIRAQ